MLYSILTLTLDVSDFPCQSWPGGPQRVGAQGAKVLFPAGSLQWELPFPLLSSWGHLLGLKGFWEYKTHKKTLNLLGAQGRVDRWGPGRHLKLKPGDRFLSSYSPWNS